MPDKRQNNKRGYQRKSRRSKPFYKKWGFWLIFVLGFAALAFSMNIMSDGVQRIEEPFELNKEVDTTEAENKEVGTAESAKPEKGEEVSEEPIGTYESFKGTYVAFEGEPYNSPIDSLSSNIIVLGDTFYQSFNRWDFDMTSPILDKKIEGNILTLELDSTEDEVWGRHSESGTEKFELRREGDTKILRLMTSGVSLYSMSIQDLQAHYNQMEIDYARIIMTINGEPSLDQWAVWNDETGIPVVNVKYNSAGDPTETSKDVPYPEDVTHLDLTNQGMGEGVITYNSQGNGILTMYPMPLHYHQEDQSEEGYKQLAQDALNQASKLYVEPFEPYIVADFIGRVKFVYQ